MKTGGILLLVRALPGPEPATRFHPDESRHVALVPLVVPKQPSGKCPSRSGRIVAHSDIGPKTAFADVSAAESRGRRYVRQCHARRSRTVTSGRGTRTHFRLDAGGRGIFSYGEVILRLQVHPHLSGCSKITGQA